MGHVPVIVTLEPAIRLGVDVPVPPLETGSNPVTPVDNGKPVAFVNVSEAGVPSPVEHVAALDPFPYKYPVQLESVIPGTVIEPVNVSPGKLAKLAMISSVTPRKTAAVIAPVPLVANCVLISVVS